MSRSNPTVHLLCGLVGAGKSTYARQLAAERSAVWFSLDAWMLGMTSLRFDDDAYGALAESCKQLIWEVAQQVLELGHDVVLDWNSWSVERRVEWRARVNAAGADLVLHYVDVPLEVAILRAETRRRSDDRNSHLLMPDDVRRHAAILEPPQEAEGIVIVHVTP